MIRIAGRANWGSGSTLGGQKQPFEIGCGITGFTFSDA